MDERSAGTGLQVNRRARHGGARRCVRAFSMIELLVVIGVVLVLLGLVVPLMGKAAGQARSTADLATIRSNTALVMQYASDHADVYPRGSSMRCGVSDRWHRPLIQTGLLASARDADPRAAPDAPMSFRFSQSLGASVLEFTRGWTRPCDESPSSDVTQSAVLFPSAKGLMVMAFGGPISIPPTRGNQVFCCGYLWKAPVSFCDGSAALGDWTEFVGPDGFVPNHEHWVGSPIVSPWGGYMARER